MAVWVVGTPQGGTMTIRNAIGQSNILAFGLLLVGGWTVVQVLNVVNLTESFTSLGVPLLTPGTPIGSAGAAGIMGVVVMLAFLGLLFVLWGELGEFDPGPEEFPPDE